MYNRGGRQRKRQATGAATATSCVVDLDLATLRQQRKIEGTVLTQKLCHALEYKPIEDVEKAACKLMNAGHRADVKVENRMRDSSLGITSPILAWAHDRYDCDEILRPLVQDETFSCRVEK